MILEARKKNPNKKDTRFFKQQAQFATSHATKKQETVVEESIPNPATEVIYMHPNFFHVDQEHVSTSQEEDPTLG